MKHSSFFLFALAVTLSLPATNSRSQLATAPVDPLAAIQSLQTTNDDLIKRQEATLKELSEMTETANEVRIFSRRG